MWDPERHIVVVSLNVDFGGLDTAHSSADPNQNLHSLKDVFDVRNPSHVGEVSNVEPDHRLLMRRGGRMPPLGL